MDTLVHLHLPQVHLYLETAGVPVVSIAVDHFLTLGARNWPMASLLRLWDLIFIEGVAAVFASFLALLELFALPTATSSGAVAQEAAMDDADFMQEFKNRTAKGL